MASNRPGASTDFLSPSSPPPLSFSEAPSLQPNQAPSCSQDEGGDTEQAPGPAHWPRPSIPYRKPESINMSRPYGTLDTLPPPPPLGLGSTYDTDLSYSPCSGPAGLSYKTMSDSGGPNSLSPSQPSPAATNAKFQKHKMKRFRLTHQQTRFLMSEFASQPHPDALRREELSRQIPGLSPRQVQVWFQNRRAKAKRLTADDRDRMIGMRAVPEGFDNLSALHSQYGAIHNLHPDNLMNSQQSQQLPPPSRTSLVGMSNYPVPSYPSTFTPLLDPLHQPSLATAAHHHGSLPQAQLQLLSHHQPSMRHANVDTRPYPYPEAHDFVSEPGHANHQHQSYDSSLLQRPVATRDLYVPHCSEPFQVLGRVEEIGSGPRIGSASGRQPLGPPQVPMYAPGAGQYPDLASSLTSTCLYSAPLPSLSTSCPLIATDEARHIPAIQGHSYFPGPRIASQPAHTDTVPPPSIESLTPLQSYTHHPTAVTAATSLPVATELGSHKVREIASETLFAGFRPESGDFSGGGPGLMNIDSVASP
ncbi:hypothetical protein BROUX41_002120 [Berkeleyomyces rouxiae]